MIKTISASEFRGELKVYGSTNKFSLEGSVALFNYLEGIDPNMELDVMTIMTKYSEDGWEDIANSYSIDIDDMEDGEAIQTVRDYLEDRTIIVAELKSPGMFVYVDF